MHSLGSSAPGSPGRRQSWLRSQSTLESRAPTTSHHVTPTSVLQQLYMKILYIPSPYPIEDIRGKKFVYELNFIEKVFLTFHELNASGLSKILGVIKFVATVLICIAFFLSTVRQLQVQPDTCKFPACDNDAVLCPGYEICEPQPFPAFYVMDFIVLIIYAVDYGLRILLCGFTTSRLAGVCPEISFEEAKQIEDFEEEFSNSKLVSRYETKELSMKYRNMQSLSDMDPNKRKGVFAANSTGELFKNLYWYTFDSDVKDEYDDPVYPWYKQIFLYMIMPQNIIDAVSILPSIRAGDLDQPAMRWIRILRLVRVFWVFRKIGDRLGRNSKTQAIIISTMKSSLPALSILALFSGISVVLFGTIIFFCESGQYKVTDLYPDGAWLRQNIYQTDLERSPYSSILISMYWAVVTSNTIGYGVITPTTYIGRMFSVACMYTGVFVLALPIAVIGNNFTRLFHHVQGIVNPAISWCITELSSETLRASSGRFKILDMLQQRRRDHQLSTISSLFNNKKRRSQAHGGPTPRSPANPLFAHMSYPTPNTLDVVKEGTETHSELSASPRPIQQSPGSPMQPTQIESLRRAGATGDLPANDAPDYPNSPRQGSVSPSRSKRKMTSEERHQFEGINIERIKFNITLEKAKKLSAVLLLCEFLLTGAKRTRLMKILAMHDLESCLEIVDKGLAEKESRLAYRQYRRESRKYYRKLSRASTSSSKYYRENDPFSDGDEENDDSDDGDDVDNLVDVSRRSSHRVFIRTRSVDRLTTLPSSKKAHMRQLRLKDGKESDEKTGWMMLADTLRQITTMPNQVTQQISQQVQNLSNRSSHDDAAGEVDSPARKSIHEEHQEDFVNKVQDLSGVNSGSSSVLGENDRAQLPGRDPAERWRWAIRRVIIQNKVKKVTELLEERDRMAERKKKLICDFAPIHRVNSVIGLLGKVVGEISRRKQSQLLEEVVAPNTL